MKERKLDLVEGDLPPNGGSPEIAARVRRAKIVCTIGPACDSDEMIRDLMLAGMDVARLNFSHGTHAEHARRIERLRRVCTSVKIPVLGIGGVNWENARECLDVGASGIAAIRLFQDAAGAAELAAQIEQFRSHM